MDTAQILELVRGLKAIGVEQFELEGQFKVAFASESPAEETSSHVGFMTDSPQSSDEDEDEDIFGSR